MATIWPVVWQVTSNLDSMGMNYGGNQINKAIPHHLDIAVRGKMDDTFEFVVEAVPEPDFEVIHYPGIDVTTTTTPASTTEGGAGESTSTTVEEKPMPATPTGITLVSTINDLGEDGNHLINISGNTLSFNVSNARYLFPIERVEYVKNWKTYVVEDTTEDVVKALDYDYVVSFMPSSRSTWQGRITLKAESSSDVTPTITIRFEIENDFDAWTRELFSPMQVKTAEFFASLDSDEDVEDIEEEDVSMEMDNSDYVETDESLFGNDIPDDESFDDIINRILDTDDDTEIEDLTKNKRDRLGNVKLLLRDDKLREALKVHKGIIQDIERDYELVELLHTIVDRLERNNVGTANSLMTDVLDDYLFSDNKRRSLVTAQESLIDDDVLSATYLVENILKNALNNIHYIPDLVRILNEMNKGALDEAIDRIDTLSPPVLDNVPNPAVANVEKDETELLNPRKDSPESMNDWFDKYINNK